MAHRALIALAIAAIAALLWAATQAGPHAPAPLASARAAPGSPARPAEREAARAPARLSAPPGPAQPTPGAPAAGPPARAAAGEPPLPERNPDPEGATVVVRVRAADGESPVPGALVAAYEPGVADPVRPIPGAIARFGERATADDAGRAHLFVPARRDLRVAVRTPGEDPRFASASVPPLEPGGERELAVTLDLVPLVHGLVVDGAGRPVAGAELRRVSLTAGDGSPAAWSAPGAPLAVTDRTGAFAVEAAAPGRPLVVQVDAVGHSPTRAWNDGTGAPDEPWVLRLARECAVAVELPGAEGALLRLSSAASLEGSEPVMLGPPVEWVAPVGRGGRARLAHLPAGVALEVEVEREGEVLVRRPAPIVLAPGETRVLQLAFGGETLLHGHLRPGRAPERPRTEGAGAEGAGLAGVELWLVPATHAGPALLAGDAVRARVARATTTAPDGSFALPGVPAGDWWLGPSPRQARLAALGRWVHVPAGTAQVSLELEGHAGVFVRGRVLDARGSPAPFAQVLVRPLGAEAFVALPGAGPDGRFAVGPLAPGPYELVARTGVPGEPEGGKPVPVRAPAQDVELRLAPLPEVAEPGTVDREVKADAHRADRGRTGNR